MAASTAPSAREVTSNSTPSLSGASLRSVLDGHAAKGKPMPLERAAALVVGLCLDLKERHLRGEKVFVHPSCIAPGPDGVARWVPHLAVAPTLPKDRACLAPELLASGEAGTARASVFAIGAILYEAITGRSVGPAMPRPREVDPELPEGIETLISKALVGDATHRPDDLGALATALHHLVPRASVAPPPSVDTSTLDRTDEFEVDVRLSLLPPAEIMATTSGSIPKVMLPATALADPFSNVVDRRESGPTLRDPARELAALKERLEADPRPRYVVNRDHMDHGPFTAVELLQQIASHTFTANDVLRDDLSGQSHPIHEWEEFAPFAEHAGKHREIVEEKKAVLHVEQREKKSGAAKLAIGLAAILLPVGAAAIWYFQFRGSRDDAVAIEEEEGLDVSGVGGLKTGGGAGGRRSGGRRAATGNAGGGAGGQSFESVMNGNNQEITIGQATGPDLTNAQLEAPLKNGAFLGACGVPGNMKVTVKAAVKLGRAIGVSVYTTPANADVSRCIERQVRGLAWPSNSKTDFVTTRY